MQLGEHFGVLLLIPLYDAERVSVDALFTVQRGGGGGEVVFTARILYSQAACDIQIKHVGK